MLFLMLKASYLWCTKLTQILLKFESSRYFLATKMECKQLSKYNPIYASPAARGGKKKK